MGGQRARSFKVAVRGRCPTRLLAAAWPILLAVGLTHCTRPATSPPPPEILEIRGKPHGALATRVSLRTATDLFESFAQGQGVLHAAGTARPVTARPASVRLSPLPWIVAENRKAAAGLLVLSKGDVNSDAMLAFVLRDGESWDVPVGRLPPGARVRFEAMSLSGDAGPELSVDVGGERASMHVVSFRPPAAALEPRGPTSVDAALPSAGADAVLSFRARGGEVVIGEARLLAPDPDPGPQYPWVVLIVGDALRADALVDPALNRSAPALRAF